MDYVLKSMMSRRLGVSVAQLEDMIEELTLTLTDSITKELEKEFEKKETELFDEGYAQAEYDYHSEIRALKEDIAMLEDEVQELRDRFC